MASMKMKFENPYSDHDYIPQHDASNEDEATTDVGGDPWDQNNQEGRRTPRRNSRKPQTFVPELPKQKAVATKRKRSIEKNGPKRGGGKKAKKNGKGKEEATKYEVDYIFGKRPDKDRKGKWEYRVLWKNFPRTEASWEPEENLRFCDEAVKAYEQGQMEEGTESNDDDEVDGGSNGSANNENVTMRKKEAKGNNNKRLVRSGSIISKSSKPAKKKIVLATMRARSASVSPPKKQVARRTGHKSKQPANNEKEASPALSHSTSGGSSGPPPLPAIDVNSKKGNSPVKKKTKKMENNNKGGKSHHHHQQPTSTSHLANNIDPRAKSESVSSQGSSSGGNANGWADIAMVESVHRSDIEGVGLVAKVIFKDGLSKKLMVDSLKKTVPLVLFEYYEKELGLL